MTASPWPGSAGTPTASGMAYTAQTLLGLANAPAERPGAGGWLPLTVVTGFLGAGKTTLLNAVLADPGGRRVAVVVNDFGTVEVDAALVRERNANTISLSNGCVCCSLAQGLGATLRLLARQAEPPDAILLEGSGVSEPDGIVHAALAQPEIRLHAIVGVVDAERTPALLRDAGLERLMRTQLSRSDLVLLNKQDVATPALLDETERWARTVAHPRVRLLRTVGARLPAGLVLGDGRRRSLLSADTGVEHDRLFEAVVLEHAGPLIRRRLAEMVGDLPDWALRAKGIVSFDAAPDRSVAVQVAGRRWSLAPVQLAATDHGGTSVSRLVVIGRRDRFDAGLLRNLFARCVAQPAAASG